MTIQIAVVGAAPDHPSSLHIGLVDGKGRRWGAKGGIRVKLILLRDCCDAVREVGSRSVTAGAAASNDGFGTAWPTGGGADARRPRRVTVKKVKRGVNIEGETLDKRVVCRLQWCIQRTKQEGN